jgi:hypothetical protein
VTRDVSRLYGIDPNYTLGMDAGRYLEHARGECHAEEPCALCLLERAEAAIARAQDFADRLPDAIAETLRQHGRDDLGGLLGRIVVQVCDGFRAALRGDQ